VIKTNTIYFLPFGINEETAVNKRIGRILPLIISDLCNLTGRIDSRYIYLFDKENKDGAYRSLKTPVKLDTIKQMKTLESIKEGNLLIGNLYFSNEGLKIEIMILDIAKENEIYSFETKIQINELNRFFGSLVIDMTEKLKIDIDDISRSEISLPLTKSVDAMDYFIEAIDILPSPAATDEMRKHGFELIKKCLELDNTFKRAFEFTFAMGIFQMKSGKLTTAIEIFNYLLKVSPNNYRVLKAIGDVWIKSNEYAKAYEPMKRAFELDGSDDTLLLKLAWVAEIMEELEFAEILYKEAWERELETVKLVEKLGLILLQQEKYADAAEYYSKGIELDNKCGPFYFGLSQSMLGQNPESHMEVEKILKQGISLVPEFWGNYYLLSGIYNDRGETEIAESTYRKAYELNPNLDRDENCIEAFKKGSELIKNGQYKEGIEILENLVEVDERFWEAYLFLGLGYRQLEESDAAIMHFTKVLSINPHHAGTHNELAVFYMEKKNYEKSLAHAKEAHTIEPEESGFLCNLGLAYLYTGDLEEAEKKFISAKWISPESEIAENCLKLLLNLKQEANKPGMIEKVKNIIGL